ncbi:MAG: thioredoxin family protein [Rikenellaceae bacterium]|nr:thioredoxin family protein [Rikenellaceae bacterium]
MTYESFLDLIDSSVPVVVCFQATWNVPSRTINSSLDKLKVQMNDRIVLLRLDIDSPENYKITQAYNIYSVPTTIIFKGGTPVWRVGGAVSAEYLQRIIERLPNDAFATTRNRRR